MNPRVRTLIAWCLCAALVFATARELRAHAILVETSPKSGATVNGPDLPVRLKFNVRIDGERSRITLVPAGGASKQLTLDKQASPDVLTTKATALTPGKYKLQWQVLAADGHISRGEIPFTVQ
jgi:methionine-rich copper-binding protein CopC